MIRAKKDSQSHPVTPISPVKDQFAIYFTTMHRSFNFFEGQDWIDSVFESPQNNSRLLSNLYEFQKELKLEEQNILFEEPPFDPSQENLQNTTDVQASRRRRKNNSDALKNFLVCLKRCLNQLKGEQLRQIMAEEVVEFLNNMNKSNKKEFQLLFNNQEARVYLEDVFQSKALQRQLQLTMMRKQNRKVFLNQLNLMKKAFIERKLPNL